MRRTLSVVGVLISSLALSGCIAAAAGYAGAQLAQDGEDVYVCREAHSARTKQALADKIASGDSVDTSRAGDHVEVNQRQEMQIEGDTQMAAYVEVVDIERSYWIPYGALCTQD